MKCLRTPDERFENPPRWGHAPHHAEIPDGEGGTIRNPDRFAGVVVANNDMPVPEASISKIQGGGHFLQEGRGAQLAKVVADFSPRAET